MLHVRLLFYGRVGVVTRNGVAADMQIYSLSGTRVQVHYLLTFPEDNILLKINTGRPPRFVPSHLCSIVTDRIWIAASALRKSKCCVYSQTKPSDAGAAQLNWQTFRISAYRRQCQYI